LRGACAGFILLKQAMSETAPVQSAKPPTSPDSLLDAPREALASEDAQVRARFAMLRVMVAVYRAGRMRVSRPAISVQTPLMDNSGPSVSLTPLQEGGVGAIIGALVGAGLWQAGIISAPAIAGIAAGVGLGSWFNAWRRARHNDHN